MVTDELKEHKKKTADHGSRNAVFPKCRAFAFYPVTKQQHQGSQGCCKNGIGFERKYILEQEQRHGNRFLSY